MQKLIGEQAKHTSYQVITLITCKLNAEKSDRKQGNLTNLSNLSRVTMNLDADRTWVRLRKTDPWISRRKATWWGGIRILNWARWNSFWAPIETNFWYEIHNNSNLIRVASEKKLNNVLSQRENRVLSFRIGTMREINGDYFYEIFFSDVKQRYW